MFAEINVKREQISVLVLTVNYIVLGFNNVCVIAYILSGLLLALKCSQKCWYWSWLNINFIQMIIYISLISWVLCSIVMHLLGGAKNESLLCNICSYDPQSCQVNVTFFVTSHVSDEMIWLNLRLCWWTEPIWMLWASNSRCWFWRPPCCSWRTLSVELPFSPCRGL